MGYPLSSGVPPVPPYPLPLPPLPRLSLQLTGHPLVLLRMTRMIFYSSLPRSDTFAVLDDRLPEEDHPHVDPSAPPISLASFRSEYRRMVDYICGLFPQAVGVLPVEPPPRALFESFFVSAPQSHPPLTFNWFEHVSTALVDADSCLASWLAAGRSDCMFIPPWHNAYVVRGPHASGRAVPVNDSLLAHYYKPLQPSLQVGLSVRDLMALESSFRAQSESLSYAMWVLSGLLGFIGVQGFTPPDPSLFNQLVTALSKSLAHQAHVLASNAAYACYKRQEFYLSHLPTYFGDQNKRSMLLAPSVFADTLFREEDFAQFLDSTRSSSSLRSQQAMVDMASRRSSSSSCPRRFGPSRSPPRSPSRRQRQPSGSPSRAPKLVRFDSPAPSLALKSPRKSHFRD